jgi:hypothetical protein
MAQYDRTADYVDITDQFIEALARWGEFMEWRSRTLARTSWWRLRHGASLWAWRREPVS